MIKENKAVISAKRNKSGLFVQSTDHINDRKHKHSYFYPERTEIRLKIVTRQHHYKGLRGTLIARHFGKFQKPTVKLRNKSQFVPENAESKTELEQTVLIASSRRSSNLKYSTEQQAKTAAADPVGPSLYSASQSPEMTFTL